MSVSLTQTATAVAPGITASFLAVGGTAPYIYKVLPNGAGGSIDVSTGVYTAPLQMSEDAALIYDRIQVRDSTNATFISQILVGSPLLLVCDILQNQMGLAQGRVYLWEQKIMQPTDDGLYVAVSMSNCKPFGNNTTFNPDGTVSQSVNMQAEIGIDIISRGPAARDRKEEVLMALMSIYSEQQQEANSFNISRLSHNFINLSEIDGSAIPYRYRIGMNLQYCINKTLQVPYFDVFQSASVVINS